jgi:CO/xanthine dehydrogenase FAD-binding subunit
MKPDRDIFEAAHTTAESMSPIADTLASTDYKRDLVDVLLVRALEDVAKRVA